MLLIDEALSTGDASFQRRSEKRIRELRAEAGTVFLVSHSAQANSGTPAQDDLGREHGPDPRRRPWRTDEVVDEYEARHDPQALEERLAAAHSAGTLRGGAKMPASTSPADQAW